jgi:hypothetical protein
VFPLFIHFFLFGFLFLLYFSHFPFIFFLSFSSLFCLFSFISFSLFVSHRISLSIPSLPSISISSSVFPVSVASSLPLLCSVCL